MNNRSRFPGFFKIDMPAWIMTAFLVMNVAYGCSRDVPGKGDAHNERKKMAMPVTVADAVEKAMPLQLKAVGTVESYATVAVKAQIEGELMSVHLEDGQCVKAGNPLFTIDPRPFEAKVKQAKANLEKDRAQLENARKLLERNASVVDRGYVSQEKYDQASADALALSAMVQAGEATLEDAELQLKYCFINSPIDGCAGEVKVDRGNLIKANDNDNPLVVIKQISPIYVDFFIPERHLPEVKKYMASKRLAVEATIPLHEDDVARGELTFLDNTVNPSTGTILLKATFSNKDKTLWPGQFVNVVLTLASQPGAVVISSQAVQTGQEGQYVFVVRPDLTVEHRPVVVERTVGNEAVIEKGIRPEEKVVTDGQLRLSQGVPVKIVEGMDRKKGDGIQ